MKAKVYKTGITLMCFLILGAFIYVLYNYASPSEDSIYNLTINDSADNELNIDAKGWTVFLQEQEKRTVIRPDAETGMYDGVEYLGQTFYYARTFHEKLNHAALSIGAVDSNIVVFLENEVIYTDCPELDNRIGHLTLPAREYDRQEGIVVSLPPDYVGKTITIAQSTSIYGSDNQNHPTAVFPAEMKLYSAFAKDSKLVSQTIQSIVPIVLLFVLALFLTDAGLFMLYRGKPSAPLFVFALLCLAQTMLHLLTNAVSDICVLPFSKMDYVTAFLPYGVCGLLLISLSIQIKSRLRMVILVCSFLEFVLGMVQILDQAGKISLEHFSLSIFEVPILLVTLVLCAKEALGKNAFMRNMLLFFGIALAFLLLCECLNGNFIVQIQSAISPGYISFTYFTTKGIRALFAGTIGSAILSFAAFTIRSHADRLVLLERQKQAYDNYQNLKMNSDQTNRLIHDNKHHLIALQGLLNTDKDKAQAYVTDLLSDYSALRAVAKTGNDLLDILLNAQIHRAAEKGIQVEFDSCSAPAQLVLTDTQASSLYMNVLENAIRAAGECDIVKKITLSLYTKDHFFVFICKNSATKRRLQQMEKRREKSYGLKIIKELTEDAQGFFRIRHTDETFEIMVVIPLTESS